MPKIPSIKKLKGDNEISFQKWILQFNAQIAALGVGNDKRRQVLLCCLDDSAFSAASEAIGADANVTYGSLVDMISKYQMEINKCEDQPKVPYEHEINVIDDQPVS